MQVLVTGGAGYIGSHCYVALIEAGWQPLILDNLSNASPAVIDRIERITGQKPGFIEGDVRDSALLDDIFSSHEITGVIHFAALKAVGESVSKPLEYYDNNVHGTLTLLATMRRAGVKTFVFSSSATVYGEPDLLPITEDFPRSAANPYGGSKLAVENILADLAHAEPDWRIARLRYFNPVGAHESGLIGEDPLGVPNNIVPLIARVAIGRLDQLSVYGGDYPTRDGTGLRDYIHVMDLAEGHLAALDYINRQPGLLTVNLGTGRSVSVLELVAAFEQASGRKVPYRIVERRPGDVAECWADPTLAQQLLGWKAQHDLDRMCADSWRWQSMNPGGYMSELAQQNYAKVEIQCS